jgi:DNA repair exonuclease SbcCD ATPase subunit
MSDVKFINAYNEIIFDNLSAILKQNIMFQTQLKLLEERVQEIPRLQEQLAQFSSIGIEKSELENKLASETGNLNNRINELTNELNSRNVELQSLQASDANAHRLQTALNTQAAEIESLRTRINSFESETNQNKQNYESILDQNKQNYESILDQNKQNYESILNQNKQNYESELGKKDDYILQLEEMLPNSKKKKLGIEIPEPVIVEEIIPQKFNNVPLKAVANGGTF